MATSHAAELGHADSATGFNRWLIPVAAVAVHICIGSVYAWSTFNRPNQGSCSRHHPGGSVRPTRHSRRRWCCWAERRVRRAVGGAARSARSGHRGGIFLWQRAGDRRNRSRAAAIRARVDRNGRDRRHRLRSRLHFAGQHAGEVVSGPARHGDGHGDHGIRRRSVSGRILERLFHGPLRRGEDGDGARRRVFHHHDDRRAHHSPASARAGNPPAGRLRRKRTE